MANLKVASSNEITVDHDVPLSSALTRGGYGRGSSKYPIERMNVGESFLVPPTSSKNFGAYVRAHCQRNHLPLKFAVRKTPEGTRCWRIA